jgi:hypothetical protein
MTCPFCLGNTEVAYSPAIGSLVCLDPGCSWRLPLDDDEVFHLFFASRKGRSAAMNARHAQHVLVPESVA